jgi:hypothetical protein
MYARLGCAACATGCGSAPASPCGGASDAATSVTAPTSRPLTALLVVGLVAFLLGRAR